MMGIFDFNHDGEVTGGEQVFGLGVLMVALGKTNAEDCEDMDRDELEELLEELRMQRESLDDEEPDEVDGEVYDEWAEHCAELDEKIEAIEDILDG